jgi:Fe-S-cluster-containing dehydrogenase component
MACITTRLPENHATFMRRVRDIFSDSPQALSFLSLACNHCADPKCLPACPQQAYSKREDGLVIQDHDLCIGCQTCIQACPYSAPVFDSAESKTYKCDMCFERIDAGELPACVVACPGSNLAAGDLDDLKLDHPGFVQALAGVTPAATETNPSLVIGLDPRLA